MRKIAMAVGYSLVIVLSGLAVGQDEPSKTEPGQSPKDLEMTIELYATIMTKMVEKAELSAEQQKQVGEVVDQYVPQLVRARHKLQNLLTAEQKDIYQKALAMAAKAKYSPKDAAAYALRKLKLDPADAKTYNETNQQVEQLDKQINEKIGQLLTEEQKARLPLFQKKPQTTPYTVKLPRMKNQQDAASIWMEMKKIEGVSDFQPDLTRNTIKFNAPLNADLKGKLTELEAAKENLFKDWKIVPAPRSVTEAADESDK